MTWHGAALEFLRRDAGLTLQELIERLGWTVQPAAISRYESETRTPTEEQVVELAAYFGVTPEYFGFAEDAHGALAMEAHMRRRATERASTWGRREARLVTYRRHLSMMLRRTAFKPTYSIPRIDPIDTLPEEAARLVRAQWRVPIGPIASVVRLLESAGCIVIEEDFGTRRIDGMSIWGAAWPVIMINSMMPPDRKRLTAAHELGHLALHDDYSAEDPEKDANRFAAEFLMPESTIRSELRSVRLDLASLANLKIEWRVSMQSIFERAHSFGFVTPDERRKFYIAMNKRGWKVNEPNSQYCVEPAPALLPAVLGKMAEAGYTRDEIAQLAGYADWPDWFKTEHRNGLRAV